MADYAVAHVEEIDRIDDGRVRWRPVRHHFGITSFGVNAFTAEKAGDRLINEHDESGEYDGQEELYVVQRGRATFELDGERVDAPAGTFVFVRPAVTRTAFAEEAGTTLVAVGGVPDKAFEAHGGEVWMPLNHLYVAGEYEELIERGREAIEAGGYPMALYNLACAESLAGRTEDAIEHLRRSIAGSERFRSLAAEDSDLDAIRAEPAFVELVGSGDPIS
jgi:tetratricopeptide (TPR) repeat protein